MAVTRIKNNQITDSTILANAKVAGYSVTAGLLANNLTYGSNFTISGNLTVNGTTTTVDTFNTLIQDPILVLADGQTSGTPVVDIGILGYRGTENSSFIGWKENASTFVAALSNTTISNTTINVTSYANFTASTITAQANLSVIGNIVGAANFSGNITGGNILTPGLISATGTITSATTITGGNLATGGTVSATGNVTGGNVLTGGLISATATITGGNLATGGTASATGNVTGGNILTGGLMSAGGNITSATNVNTPNVVGASSLTLSTGSGDLNLQPFANVALGNRYINGVAYPVGNTDAASKLYVDNMVSTQIAYHQAVVAATTSNLATATGGTITYTQPNGAANGVGALLTTTGAFNLIDTANIQTVGTRVLVKNEGNAVFNGVYTWANATNIVRSTDADQYGPNSSEELSINDYFFVSGGSVNEGSAWIVDAPSGVITFGTSNISFAQFSQSQVYEANTSAGLVLNATTFSAKVDGVTTAFDGGGNISVKVSANLTTPNIGAATGTSLSVTGAVNAGTTMSAAGNITGGNVLTGGLVSATGNITGGNLLTGAGGVISGSGNITGGNILTGGLISAVGTGTFGNITVGLDSINSANSRITVNSGSADTDIAVNGLAANVFYIDAGANTASFGASTQVTNAIVNFATTTSIKLPAGNTVQRPATGVTGMIRFNSTTNGIEIYNNTEWIAVGSTIFTVIADQQFNGDGSTVAFTLSSSQTTNSCIVSINGVVQIPTSAYSVSSTTLTFTEAPASGDLIDVRQLTTTTSVVNIVNGNGNAEVAVSDTSNVVAVTGSMSIAGSITASSFVGLDATKIANGTSQVAVLTTGGNIQSNISGTTVMTISPGLVDIVGNLTVSGNATLSGNILGDRIQNGTTSIDIQTASGNANITVGATSNVAVFSTTGEYVTGVVSATGNIYSGSSGNIQLGMNTSNVHFTNNTGSGNITFLTNFGGTGVVDVFKVLGTGTQGVLANGIVSVTGDISLIGNVVDTGPMNLITSSNGNISLLPNGSGNVNTGANIMPTSNATANIGSASFTYNTIFAKATSAQYADLAEKYTADAEYAPGTVVAFGGTHEVTLSTQDGDRRVAGVISTNPSYIMNGGLEGANIATVALTGRVPTKVTGTVAKGDLMVSNGDGTARAEADPKAGAIIGKALEDSEGNAVIEVVVGRF
jgi:filamentous hemagglutinin